MGSLMPEHDLIEFCGPAAGLAMIQWASEDGRGLFLPAEPWKAIGFTEAFAASVIVGAATAGESDRYLVAKVVPEKDGREWQAHEAALRTGEFAQRHLAGLFGRPIRCPDGRTVFFQELAGRDHRFRPAALLGQADATALVELCENVMAAIATSWNPTVRACGARLNEFVLAELRHPLSGTASVERWANDLGLGHPDTAWLRLPAEQEPLPNPVLLGYGHPAFADQMIDLLPGHGHGDLHLGNLMVLRDWQGVRPDRYQLIDLSTYSADAPRGRDEVTLLLSAIAWLWRSLSELHRNALLTEVTRPERTPHERQDPLLIRLVNATYGSALSTVQRGSFTEAWRRQYLLVLLTTALRFTTFENLPADLRWWLVRVACHAARAYAYTVGVETPSRALHLLQNTFCDGPDSAGGLEPARPPVSWSGLSVGGHSPFAGDER